MSRRIMLHMGSELVRSELEVPGSGFRESEEPSNMECAELIGNISVQGNGTDTVCAYKQL